MLESRGGGESGCIQTPPSPGKFNFFQFTFFFKIIFRTTTRRTNFLDPRHKKKKEKKDFYPTATGRPANKFLHLDKHNKKIMKNR